MEDYLEEIGLKEFSKEELEQISKNYSEELKAGIDKRPSSLKMLDTLLSPVDLNILNPGDEVLVLEIGGTNVYGARVVIDSDHNPKITPGSYTKVEMSKRQFSSFKQFIDEVIEGISNLITQSSTPKAFGLIWSFPAKPVKVDYGIDNTETLLTKELIIPGVEDVFIGRVLVEEFSHKNLKFKNLKIAVLNDTPAVALSTGSLIGAVVGTGFNISVAQKDRLFNTESGNFNKFPISALVRLVDAGSQKTGEQLAEKQISGHYMGEQLKFVMDGLVEKGLNESGIGGVVNSSTISHLLENPALDPKLVEVASKIRTKSAQIVGVMIGTAISTFFEQFKDLEKIEVPIEGSVFWNMPGYSDIAQDVANKFAGKKVVCKKIEHGGILGAAIAALSLKSQLLT